MLKIKVWAMCDVGEERESVSDFEHRGSGDKLCGHTAETSETVSLQTRATERGGLVTYRHRQKIPSIRPPCFT